MTPVTFHQSTQLVDSDTLNQLHEDGVIDRVRLDGKDFFVGADVALDLRNDGVIKIAKESRMDGAKSCRGWVGAESRKDSMALAMPTTAEPTTKPAKKKPRGFKKTATAYSA